MEIVSESDSSTCGRENVSCRKDLSQSWFEYRREARIGESGILWPKHIFPFIPVSNEPSGRAYRWFFVLYQKRISLIQIGTAWWIQPQKTKFRYPAQMAQWNRKWMGCVDWDKKRLPEEDNSSKEVIRRPLIWRLCVRNLIQASPLIPFKRTIGCGLRIVCIRRKEIFRSRPEICRMIYNRTVRVKKRLYLL